MNKTLSKFNRLLCLICSSKEMSNGLLSEIFNNYEFFLNHICELDISDYIVL